MVGGKHRSNMELVAQGVGNIFSGLFGGIPATGAIARTATNVKNGGRTPIAGIVHSIFLLLTMLFFIPIAKLIPLSCLAGILVVVAYHMSEWRQFRDLLKATVWTSSCFDNFLHRLLRFDFGYWNRIDLSSFIFMKRWAEATTVDNRKFTGNSGIWRTKTFEENWPTFPKVLCCMKSTISMFAASQKFQDILSDLREEPKVLILRMRHVPSSSISRSHPIKGISWKLHGAGTKIIISGAQRR